MNKKKQDNSDSVQVIRGTPFPKSKHFIEKNIVDAMDYEPEDGDIIIASYPKTGTTWLQYIVLQIISKAQQFPSMHEATQKVVPFLELVGLAALDSAQKPKIYKSHIAYNLVKKNRNSKCIYIYRNPDDTVVSYYHFRQSMEKDFINFEEFFERFLSGNIEYGSYFHHVMSFLTHRNDSNLLIVSYEKLHANTKEEILRMAKFLGEEHYLYLEQNKDILNKIIENTSFDSMKKNLHMMVPGQPESDKTQTGENGKSVIQFFRKGVVGDGKTVLSETQRRLLRERVETVMKDTEIGKEWLRN